MTPPANRTDLDVEEICGTPAWLPLESLRENTLRLVRLTESQYRTTSFLDSRVLQLQPPEAHCTSATLCAAADHLAPNAYFIFHIGHVGSTLISRLIGEHPSLFALREPALLRAMAVPSSISDSNLTLTQQLALLSRAWHAEQRAVIKTTSFVNAISSSLLTCSETSRAILVFTGALTYLRAIFGGPNSRLEIKSLSSSRLQRIQTYFNTPLPIPVQEGEWVAMSWLCEMTSLATTAQQYSTRVRWLNFEIFLRDPGAGLATTLEALGVESRPSWIDQVLGSSLMRRYSKAPEHDYDSGLRHAVLAQADREHAGQIHAGLKWLERLRDAHPLVASAFYD